MIEGKKKVGFYTDVFGNEIDVYELIERYTVFYEGRLFEEDNDGYNEHGCDRFEDAVSLFYAYGNVIKIRDNEYGVIFVEGEWI